MNAPKILNVKRWKKMKCNFSSYVVINIKYFQQIPAVCDSSWILPLIAFNQEKHFFFLLLIQFTLDFLEFFFYFFSKVSFSERIWYPVKLTPLSVTIWELNCHSYFGESSFLIDSLYCMVIFQHANSNISVQFQTSNDNITVPSYKVWSFGNFTTWVSQKFAIFCCASISWPK